MTALGADVPAALSVVLVASGGVSSVDRTMRHLRSQSARRAMEVIVVAPSNDTTTAEAFDDGTFAALRVVAVGPITARGDAAARGIQAATAPIVGLIEDHSFPEPGWAAALISAHAGPWAGVGPAVENANRKSVMSWVNFILSYGAFAGIVESGERDILPWHNSAYKAEALAPFADRLGALLEWEGALQEEMRASGHRLYLEAGARTHHMNVSGMLSTFGLNLLRGRILGALRATRECWPLWRRIVQACGFPLFPLMQLRHMSTAIDRMAVPSALKSRVMLGLTMALVVMAFGEALGLAFGIGDSIAKIEDYELHRTSHLSHGERVEMSRSARKSAGPDMAREPTSA